TLPARFPAAAISSFTSPTVMPKSSSPPLIWRAKLADSSSAFVGMHPQLLQTPPSFCASTQATFIPSCAARIAATSRPGPPPITITSNVLSATPHLAVRVLHRESESVSGAGAQTIARRGWRQRVCRVDERIAARVTEGNGCSAGGRVPSAAQRLQHLGGRTPARVDRPVHRPDLAFFRQRLAREEQHA